MARRIVANTAAIHKGCVPIKRALRVPARTGPSPIWGKTFPTPVCYNPAVSGFAANFRGVAAAVLLAGGGFAAAADT